MTILSQYRAPRDSLFPMKKKPLSSRKKKGFYIYLDGGSVSTPEPGNPFSDVTMGGKGSWEMFSKSSARSLPAVACIDSEEIPPPP